MAVRGPSLTQDTERAHVKVVKAPSAVDVSQWQGLVIFLSRLSVWQVKLEHVA